MMRALRRAMEKHRLLSGSYVSWIGAGRPHPVHMLVQRRVNGVPEGIKNKVDSFTPRELRGRNEVRIACYQDNLIDLPLVAQRCDVEADAHIDALLCCRIVEIVVDERIEFEAALQQALQFAVFQPPFRMIHQMSETKSDFPRFAQFIVQGNAEDGLRCLGKIDGLAQYGRVSLFLEWGAIVEEYSVKIVMRISFFKMG